MGQLFRGDIIRENHLRFWEEVSYNEDRLFVTEYMMYAENVHWISARNIIIRSEMTAP